MSRTDTDDNGIELVESAVLRLVAAAHRGVPTGALVLQARDLGRTAALLRVTEPTMYTMLRHSLEGIGRLDDRTIATLCAAAENGRKA